MKLRYLAAAVTACVTLILPATVAGADPAHHTTSPVFVFGNPSQTIPGATSTLVTHDAGATMTLHTSQLSPGHAVTVWWVVFNQPQACTGGVGGLRCGESDLSNAAVQASVLYAAGRVVGRRGTGHWGAHLAVGDTDGALFGPGLLDPTTADIHLVVRDHGPADPALLPAEIHSFDVCNPTCTDVQASAHEQ
jgi:hypothetical protein